MLKRTVTPFKKSRAGFTFIELLLVIVIIGTILAVIIPRAWRANIEAKYGLVQQAATELASWGMTWAERNQESQPETDTCILDDYIATLVNYTGDQSTNWVNDTTTVPPAGGCASAPPTYTVSDIMSQEKQPRNPFNGVSYFNTVNDGSSLQTGILFLGVQVDTDGYNNYYFVYTGTDSTAFNEWHAGMGTGASPPLANLRNGLFMARLRP